MTIGDSIETPAGTESTRASRHKSLRKMVEGVWFVLFFARLSIEHADPVQHGRTVPVCKNA